MQLLFDNGTKLTDSWLFHDGSVSEYEYEGTDQPIMRVVRNSVGAVISTTAYLTDKLGNVIGDTTNGVPSASISYDPWGNYSSTGGNSPAALRFGFKGMLYDSDAELYYARVVLQDISNCSLGRGAPVLFNETLRLTIGVPTAKVSR